MSCQYQKTPRWFVALLIGMWSVIAVGIVATCNRTAVPPPADGEAFAAQPVYTDDGRVRHCGRVKDDEAAEAVRSTFPAKYFGDTPAGRAKLGDEKRVVLLTDAAKAVTGAAYVPLDQGQVGSCVGCGHAGATNVLMQVQIARGEMLEYVPVSPEVIYAGSRVEVGGGRIRGDGSVGAWAVKFIQNWGVVSQAVHGKYDLTRYDEARCRSWGRSGVPDDLEPLARQSPVKGVASVRTWAELVKAVSQGYPVTVCSDVGFSTTRDRDGFLKASGTWAHCMFFAGVDVGNGRDGALCVNSWGPDWVRGPKGKHDIPPGSFWIDRKTVERMLAENDSWALSDATGFPQRDEFFIRFDPLFVHARPRHVAPGRDVTRKDGVPCSLAW